MPREKEREGQRVVFERPLPAQMMAIDGTWRRPGLVKDVSENSATLRVESSIEGLALTEFFLVLSSTGLAYRRCQLDRVNGDEIEVTFLRQNVNKKLRGETSACSMVRGPCAGAHGLRARLSEGQDAWDVLG
ncbi:hypothetical protein [Bradyrhizobium huanghuaihaiense]|uniref:hypothetical protein n=1 Tax=Bradyrhizobium huanghuaihaiense TaxID=990078 RepID=UPI003CC591FE